LLPFDADFLGVRRRGVRLGVFLVDIVEGVFSQFLAKSAKEIGKKTAANLLPGTLENHGHSNVIVQRNLCSKNHSPQVARQTKFVPKQ